MNPAKTALDLIGKPVGAVSHALNRPSSMTRNAPLYGLNLLDAIRGGSLEDAEGRPTERGQPVPRKAEFRAEERNEVVTKEQPPVTETKSVERIIHEDRPQRPQQPQQ